MAMSMRWATGAFMDADALVTGKPPFVIPAKAGIQRLSPKGTGFQLSLE
jgi:hypothetical protein